MRYAIYGYDGCSWCNEAKNLLIREGFEFDYYDLAPGAREEFLDSHGFTKPELRTFPKVWRDGRLIGGYRELNVDIQKLDVNMEEPEAPTWDDDLVGGVENFS